MLDTGAHVIKLRPKLAVNNEKCTDNGRGTCSGESVKDGLVMGLRHTLEMAEAGEIVAAIITTVEKDGQVGSTVIGAEDGGRQLISGSLFGVEMVTDILLGVDGDEFDDGGKGA
jgi:hypothetical protein